MQKWLFILTDDWELVFHAPSGNGEDVLKAWKAKHNNCDIVSGKCPCSITNGCLPYKARMETFRSSKKVLRSPYIDYWNCLNIQKVYMCTWKKSSLSYMYLTLTAWVLKIIILNTFWLYSLCLVIIFPTTAVYTFNERNGLICLYWVIQITRPLVRLLTLYTIKKLKYYFLLFIYYINFPCLCKYF